jgi:23S rRNA pseudouridine2605 synthase
MTRRPQDRKRLQKVLAAAGVASRRDCEELIREGRVEIDKQVVTELGTRVDPLKQEIRVDGEPLRRPKRVYFALNKPVDVVCTNFDPSGRARVIDLVPNHERVFAVGRLDRASEGLILVTNDGSFANHITHPRYGVEKTYLVRVAGRPGPEQLAKLRRGVHLAEGFCKVESVVVKGRHKQSTDLLMVLDEGRNREIRRVLAKVGHKVVTLRRIAIGGLKLGPLEPGEWRKLTPTEIESLLSISRKKRKEKKVPPRSEETELKDIRPGQRPGAAAEDSDEDGELPQEPRLKAERSAAAAKKPSKKRDDTDASPTPPGKKPPSASSIAAKLLSGADFEDEEEEFLDSLTGDDDWDGDDEDLDEDDQDEGDQDDESEEDASSEGFEVDSDDDDLEIGELRDDDLVKETMILEETPDTPPRSGPAPRGGVIDFDEDSPPPLQPARVRESRSAGPKPRRRAERGQSPQRAERSEGPLRAEPRGEHRHRGSGGAKSGQAQRRGQRHRSAEEFESQTGRGKRPAAGRPGAGRPGTGGTARGERGGAARGERGGFARGERSGRTDSRRDENRGRAENRGRDDRRGREDWKRDDRRPAGAPAGERARGGRGREDVRRGDDARRGEARGRVGEGRGRGTAEGDREISKKMPRRPGKLVPNRPQEERGARGKYPGKSTGKGSRETFGGGSGGRTIFGKRVKKRRPS